MLPARILIEGAHEPSVVKKGAGKMAEFTFTADPTASTSVQGQLASQYTNWVNAQIKAIADYIGYLVAQKTGDVEAGKAAVAAIESGNFSITDLFNAAQQKGSGILDVAGDPTPKLLINGLPVDIDITDFMGDPETVNWTTTAKAGKTTETTYHAREFYGTIAAGEYPDDWADVQQNRAPTLTVGDASNELLEAGETLNHQLVEGVFKSEIQLTAADPDGDTLTYNTSGWTSVQDADGNDTGVFTKAGTYGTASLDTATGLVTYTLDSSVDLPAGATEIDTFTMSVSDGEYSSSEVDITFTINGTGDWYKASLEPIVVIKGDSFPDSGSVEFDEDNVELLSVTVTGKGDYDWVNEGFSLSGDAVLNFNGVNTSNSTGNSSPEKLLNVIVGPLEANIAGADTTDESFDYAVVFDNQTQNGSYVNIVVDYQYWA
jgi:VCBS repeat-containing protein